ncbi:hypothetical protein IMSAG013_00721 [Clostridiales bacterium]|nr:hypothetical protein IMSAG013_00721 [Clostridiales bacterium]
MFRESEFPILGFDETNLVKEKFDTNKMVITFFLKSWINWRKAVKLWKNG